MAARSDQKRTYLTLLVTSVLVFAFAVLAPTTEMQELRRLAGLGGERLDAAPAVPTVRAATSSCRPSRRAASRSATTRAG